jgi:tetratricopeptide (TPR) repeat protein
LARALEAFQKGNYAHALVLFEKEIKENDQDPTLYYHFALSCFHTKNYKKAVEVARNILERFPRFIELDKTNKLLIYSLIQLSDWKSAKKAIEERLTISPNDEVLLSFLAHVHEKTNNVSKAIFIHRQILGSHPNFKTSLNNLGYLLLMQDKPSTESIREAIDCLKKAIQLDPDNPAYLDSFGTLLEKTGKKDQAIRALEKAVALAPNQSILLDHLDKLRNS